MNSILTMYFDRSFFETDLSSIKKNLSFSIQQGRICSQQNNIKKQKGWFQPDPSLKAVNDKLKTVFLLLTNKSGQAYNQLIHEIGTEERFKILIGNLKVINTAFERTRPGIFSRIILAAINFFRFLLKRPKLTPTLLPLQWNTLIFSPPTNSKSSPLADQSSGVRFSVQPQLRPLFNLNAPVLEQKTLKALFDARKTENQQIRISAGKDMPETFAFSQKGFCHLLIKHELLTIDLSGRFLYHFDRCTNLHKELISTTPCIGVIIKKETQETLREAERETKIYSKLREADQRKADTFLLPFKKISDYINDNGDEEVLFLSGAYVGTFNQIKNFLNFNEKLSLAIDIAEGIQFLHDQGYIHQQIHADTLFVSKENEKYKGLVGNLGAAVLEKEAKAEAGGKQFAPELASGQNPPTKASDIYNLGLLLCMLFYDKSENNLSPVIKLYAEYGEDDQGMQARKPVNRPTIAKVVNKLKEIQQTTFNVD